MILTKILHGLIFTNREKIRTLWTQFFVDLLKNAKSAKINPRQIKLAKINLREN